MYTFKPITKENTVLEEHTLYTLQNLTTSSIGLVSYQYRSGSLGSGSIWSQVDTSGSYWNFLHYNYYLSGSSTVNVDESTKFNSIYNSKLYRSTVRNHEQYRNKFYSSGSIIYIPNYYIGDQIKPGSFKFTDLDYTSSISRGMSEILYMRAA